MWVPSGRQPAPARAQRPVPRLLLGGATVSYTHLDVYKRQVLHCEIEAVSAVLDKAVAGSLREVTKLRGEVAFCAPGGLANDGKVIEDSRVY